MKVETKQKIFRMTHRSADLLKITAGLSDFSETEIIELAIEMFADPSHIELINQKHGERVSRKKLRKPRTTKPKKEPETEKVIEKPALPSNDEEIEIDSGINEIAVESIDIINRDISENINNNDGARIEVKESTPEALGSLYSDAFEHFLEDEL